MTCGQIERACDAAINDITREQEKLILQEKKRI
jgi:hypothetical protein